MTISNPKIVHSLIATAVATRPATSWREKIGASAETTDLPGVNTGFECAVTLGAVGDELSVDLINGVGSVTGSGTAATGTLTLSGNAVAGETVTIGTRVYTWVASAPAANQVTVGGSASASLDNLIACITMTGGTPGTTHGSATVAHADVTATAGVGDTMTVTTLEVGIPGNSIATTETMTAGSFGAAALSGGRNVSTITPELLGNDLEGVGLTDLVATDAIRIRCTAGAVSVVGGSGQINLLLPTNGVLLLADHGANTDLMTESLLITATEHTAAVSLEVLGHIAD